MSNRDESAPDRRLRRRRFTILDGMILTAFAASGCYLARIGPNEWMSWPLWDLGQISMLHRGPATLLLAAMSLSIIPLRLRRPRPARARMMRQPGVVMAVAVAVAVALGAVSSSMHFLRVDRGGLGAGYFAFHWRSSGKLVAPAVAGSWLALWIGGRWRAERGWIDRLGRALGFAWLAVLPTQRPFVSLPVGLIQELAHWGW